MRKRPKEEETKAMSGFWRVCISISFERIPSGRGQVQEILARTLTRDHSRSFRHRSDYGIGIPIL
jgi:hypothetical protein